MAGLGVPELLIILVILLLVLGPKRLPGLGRQIGGGMREFKDSITGKMDDDDEDEQRVAGLPAPSPATVVDEPVQRVPDDSGVAPPRA